MGIARRCAGANRENVLCGGIAWVRKAKPKQRTRRTAYGQMNSGHKTSHANPQKRKIKALRRPQSRHTAQTPEPITWAPAYSLPFVVLRGRGGRNSTVIAEDNDHRRSIPQKKLPTSNSFQHGPACYDLSVLEIDDHLATQDRKRSPKLQHDTKRIKSDSPRAATTFRMIRNDRKPKKHHS